MRIIMHAKKTIAGPNGCALGGQEIDLPDDQAKAVIQSGDASPVRGEAIEKAIVEPQETASKAPKKGNGK